MKSFLLLFFKALPFTIGVILTLTALAFLADVIQGDIGLGDLNDREFQVFALFALLGIPCLLFGVFKLSDTKQRPGRGR